MEAKAQPSVGGQDIGGRNLWLRHGISVSIDEAIGVGENGCGRGKCGAQCQGWGKDVPTENALAFISVEHDERSDFAEIEINLGIFQIIDEDSMHWSYK